LPAFGTTRSRLGGIAQAESYIRDIESACRKLAGGVIVSRDAGHVWAGYRKARVGQHFLFFVVGSEGSIDIVRILHERMDVEARLGNDA
jgi:toxin ParE1/3/4